MRTLLRVGCAAALLACSDAHAPTAVSNPRQLPDLPRVHADSLHDYNRLDGRAIPERVAELISRRLGKVILPADGFSLATDAVHPDIACPPSSWNGASCW